MAETDAILFYKLESKLVRKRVHTQFGKSDNGMVFSDRYMKYCPKPILQGSHRYSELDP